MTDKEVRVGVGNFGLTRIEGNVTAGSDSPIRSLRDIGGALGNVAAAAAATAMATVMGGPLGLLFGGGALAGLAASVAAVPKANGLCRVFGRRGAPRDGMVQVAVNYLMDRFFPLAIGGQLFIVSMYATQDAGSDNPPFVEVRMEFLCININAILAMFDTASAPQMVRWTDIHDIGTFVMTPDSATPQMPASNNTRGSWIRALAVAALKGSTCTLPAAPTDPGTASDEDALA